jgi:hypothetical protein
MQSEFSFVEMKSLYDNGLLKDHIDCKQYISKYIFPLLNGTHAMVENEQVTIVQKETMNEVYISRFPKDIKNWYKTETLPKKLICDVTKPTVGDNFINISKTLKHKYEEYETMDTKKKEGVQLLLKYIKEVWANNDEAVYNYILKWLSNMVKGKKNKTCIYAKCVQGAGKSTLPEFIRDWVIGRDVTCKGKSDHLKGQHNLQLLGRIFVYFEELQFFSDKEWNAVDSELKDMITDEYGSYTDKYEKRFEAENINNYMVITNNSIKGVNGRRYLVVDISSKYTDDFEYYGNLRKTCFNDEIGKAFYCYLKEIDTENFNSLIMPETKNKLDIVAELLTPIEKFLKFTFVLRNANINMKVKELYQHFKDYDNSNISIQRFCTLMRELGFEYHKINGYSIYKINFNELETLAKKRKWLHVLDSEEECNDIYEKCLFIKEDDKAEYIRAEIYKQLENKLLMANELIKMQNDMIENTRRTKKVIYDMNDMITKLDKKYEDKINKLTKRVNDLDMTVASIQNDQMFSDDESDNNSETTDEDDDVVEDRKETDTYTKLANDTYVNDRTGEELVDIKTDIDLSNKDEMDSFFNFV